MRFINKFWILKIKFWQLLLVFRPIWLFSVFLPLFWREKLRVYTRTLFFGRPLTPLARYTTITQTDPIWDWSLNTQTLIQHCQPSLPSPARHSQSPAGDIQECGFSCLTNIDTCNPGSPCLNVLSLLDLAI